MTQEAITLELLNLDDLTITAAQQARIDAINAYYDDDSPYPPRFEYYQDLENPGEEDARIVWKYAIHGADENNYDNEQEAVTLDDALDQEEGHIHFCQITEDE